MTGLMPLPTRRRRREPAVTEQALRRFRPPADAVLPAVPWQGLFLQPVYADGQPYDRDEDDDDGDR